MQTERQKQAPWECARNDLQNSNIVTNNCDTHTMRQSTEDSVCSENFRRQKSRPSLTSAIAANCTSGIPRFLLLLQIKPELGLHLFLHLPSLNEIKHTFRQVLHIFHCNIINSLCYLMDLLSKPKLGACLTARRRYV